MTILLLLERREAINNRRAFTTDFNKKVIYGANPSSRALLLYSIIKTSVTISYIPQLSFECLNNERAAILGLQLSIL